MDERLGDTGLSGNRIHPESRPAVPGYHPAGGVQDLDDAIAFLPALDHSRSPGDLTDRTVRQE